PSALHPLDAARWPDRVRSCPTIPALERLQRLGVVPVLGELFGHSWRRWIAARLPGQPDRRHESTHCAAVGSGTVALLLQARRALSGLWLGISHPLRSL